MPVLCPRANGTSSTHVLTVLSIDGMKRLLTSAKSPLATHVLKFLLGHLKSLEVTVRESPVNPALQKSFYAAVTGSDNDGPGSSVRPANAAPLLRDDEDDGGPGGEQEGGHKAKRQRRGATAAAATHSGPSSAAAMAAQQQQHHMQQPHQLQSPHPHLPHQDHLPQHQRRAADAVAAAAAAAGISTSDMEYHHTHSLHVGHEADSQILPAFPLASQFPAPHDTPHTAQQQQQQQQHALHDANPAVNAAAAAAAAAAAHPNGHHQIIRRPQPKIFASITPHALTIQPSSPNALPTTVTVEGFPDHRLH